MTNSTPALFSSDARSEWLRLRTLSLLRWVAIAGQALAVTIAHLHFDLRLELGYVFMVIGASVIANLVALFVYPENKRVTEAQALAMLLFDIAQLVALLYLTGGLHNPFAFLIVVPVTISATALHLRSTLVLGAVAIFCATALTAYHLPLRTEQGFVLRMPDIFVFGYWVAILIGTLFMGVYARRVTSEIHSMSEGLLATQMALSREQKLTDLGGVVAAAAHELGTPLATIKLVSSELVDELADRTDLRDDAQLIRDQADRCREILRSMGRAGKDDTHLRSALLSAIVAEAAEPHLGRGKEVIFDYRASSGGGPEPTLRRQPELIHGLRNLVQNAVDFAESRVWVEARWSERRIRIKISDDGPGFAPQLLGRIGDPFVRRRRNLTAKQRPEYEGMGLGLFIAKTLLERTRAELSFANGADPFLVEEEKPEKCGAIVELIWPRDERGPEETTARKALAKNQPITS